MTLTPFQLSQIRSILNYEIPGNVKSVTTGATILIVDHITRMAMIELDHYLGTHGITVRPNDTKTLKITIL